MSFKFFSRNGEILPSEQAVVSLDDIAYGYGYGVYETIRVAQGIPYFINDHLERFMISAQAITLEHAFTPDFVKEAIVRLIEANKTDTSNIKMLLIGGRTAKDATLYIQMHNPLFPDRKLYKKGAHTITEQYERLYPQAKTLNMLPSYLAYKKASVAGAYDALLVNHSGCITEGTRTNFYVLQGKTIISPPSSEILLGVMRKAILRVAAINGFEFKERPIPLESLAEYDAAFISSTSTKIMPLHSVDEFEFGDKPPALIELMRQFDEFYKNCKGKLE